jgi:hypothetical protein
VLALKEKRREGEEAGKQAVAAAKGARRSETLRDSTISRHANPYS